MHTMHPNAIADANAHMQLPMHMQCNALHAVSNGSYIACNAHMQLQCTHSMQCTHVKLAMHTCIANAHNACNAHHDMLILQ